MKLLVVSICKDEGQTIGKVLQKIPQKIEGITEIEKWVIDDGSTDNTAQEAKKHGAQVLSDGVQKRLAFRFREAVELALRRDADILVNVDGDLQFDPKQITKLTGPIVKDEADFVSGSRFVSEGGAKTRPANMPYGKYVGNKIGAKIVSRLSKQSFNDVTCGFRAYNERALIALNINNSYTYTQESFQVLAIKKLRIKSVPVEVKYFPGRKSRVVTSIVTYISRSAISILRSYRDFAPLRFFGWLGAIPFFIGLICAGITVIHWLNTGSFTPYKFLGFTGIYFLTLGLLLWALGLVADMLSRILSNQEKILESVKEIQHKKK